MKVVLIILSFITFFIISQYFVEFAFAGHKVIKTFFSLAISGIFIAVAFGAADTLMADEEAA